MESPERRKDQAPFKDELVESDVSEFHKGTGAFLETTSYPGKIVRVETFLKLAERYGGEVDPIEAAAMGQSLYRELDQEYGIPTPVDFLVGKDPQNREVVYSIVDKIEGLNLDQAESTQEIAEKVEELYGKIAQYYLDKLSKDEPYLVDIAASTQYVYGHTQTVEEDRIYLVDTDLFIKDGSYAMYDVVCWFLRHMIPVERKFDLSFTRARMLIRQFVDAPIPPSCPEEGRARVEKTKDEMRGYLDAPRKSPRL